MIIRSTRLAAILAASAVALSACGGSEAVDDTSQDAPGQDSAADCETDVDCDDTGGDAAGTRPADGEAPPVMGMCAPDVPDCDDMVVVGEDAVADGDAVMAPDIHVIDELSPDTRVVEMAPGSVADAHPLFLQEAVVDGAMVTVTFSGGETPCFVVDHAEVVESEDRVVVTVYAGQPDPDAQGCDEQEISSQAISVQLDAELGGRDLLDGSRLAPQDAQN